MFKKGQAAMEFLMTYGWAILVVLAAIGALAYFGVLSPDNLLPERTSFQAPIPNVDTAAISIDGSNNLVIAIAFSNSVGQTIDPAAANAKISSLTVDGTAYDCDAGVTGTDVASTSNAATFTYTWTCDDTTAFNAVTMKNKRVKADLSFEYVNSYTGQTKTQSGNINGKVTG